MPNSCSAHVETQKCFLRTAKEVLVLICYLPAHFGSDEKPKRVPLEIEKFFVDERSWMGSGASKNIPQPF